MLPPPNELVRRGKWPKLHDWASNGPGLLGTKVLAGPEGEIVGCLHCAEQSPRRTMMLLPPYNFLTLQH
eukprot:5197574-Amphidinium_carterae.1